jgi:hypothetical protein
VYALNYATKCPSLLGQLNEECRKQQIIHLSCFLKVFSSLRYLARQGIAFRRADDLEDNFRQLLHLRCEDCPELKQFISDGHYISHDIHLEVLQMMHHRVIREIIQEIRESRDITGREQMAVCITYVHMGELQEDFIGFYEVIDMTGAAIEKSIVDASK